MQLFRGKLHTHYLLIAILLLATVLRFWNFSTRISLGGDSARDAFVAAYGARALQLPLTGPFSSLGQFTFGPWYYYELIAADLLLRTPFSPWIFMTVASIAVTYLMFLLGKKLVNTEVGLLMAALAAIAPAQLSAQGLTNPNLISFFATAALLVFLWLLTDKKEGEYKAWLLGIVLGIGVNHHYQMAGMLLLPLFLLLRKNAWPQVVKAYVGVAFTFLPLLFFDLNNHWFTIRHLTDTYIHGTGRIYVPNRWLFYLRDFWPQFWAYVFGVPRFVASIVMIAAASLAAVSIAKKKVNSAWLSIGAIFFVQFVSLRYYWGDRFMGYLQYLHPYIFLATSIVLWKTKKLPFGQIVYPVAVVLFVGLTLRTGLRELMPSDFYIHSVKRADALEKLYPSAKGYKVYSCSRSGWDYTQALAYVLYTRGKLSESGIAIGVPPGCILPLPEDREIVSMTEKEREALRASLYPAIPGFDAVVIEAASPGAREKAGFSEISPWRLYQSTVRWWFNEQP